MGKLAAALYGRPVLRASLRTSNYAEARRRLVDNLGWACEIVEAPDLEVLGGVLSKRLAVYIRSGPPNEERLLVERVAFEHQVRALLTRSRRPDDRLSYFER